MTRLYFADIPVRAVSLNGESTLPCLYDIQKQEDFPEVNVSEDDGLFINYETVRTGFPYRSQDNYTREFTADTVQAAVLENDSLKAVFTPQYGGKMWSLYDKKAGKELLFSNHVFLPAYLAIRNAWTSGGVEWNCGAFTGHHPYTCSPIFAAVLSEKESGLGCPVLRMYNFERIREVTYQMDFYLPEGSDFLYCRMRVVNDSKMRTDMYWWSNIAVAANEKARNVVPADEAYNPYGNGEAHVSVPVWEGRDITYPSTNPIAVDYFYKTKDGGRYYTSYIDENGYGLAETSTSLLKGRKLFVWGRGQGGAKWQEYLSGDDGRGNFSEGRYYEIQCGLAHTQYECIPMPPKTAWEWIECYGAVSCNREKVHGEWKDARGEVENVLESMLPLAEMEKELEDTRKMALTPAGRVFSYGEGWAALENLRRKKNGLKAMSAHLDFGVTGPDQEMWVSLLEKGNIGKPKHISYMRSANWTRMLEKACSGTDKDNLLAHYELGCTYMADGRFDEAEKEIDLSLKLGETSLNVYAKAELSRIKGNIDEYASLCVKAFGLSDNDASLCKMTSKALAEAEKWDDLYTFISGLDVCLADIPRVRLYTCMALLHTGRTDEAYDLLYAYGGLSVPDIREGEVSITNLWFDIAEAKAKKDGESFEREKAVPPKMFDFRMNAD